MYHKQQVYKRLSRRRILDYNEENLRILRISTLTGGDAHHQNVSHD